MALLRGPGEVTAETGLTVVSASFLGGLEEFAFVR